MSHPKGHLPFRKDSEGKNLFTWKQFPSPFNGNSTSAIGRESRHSNSFEYVGEETRPEQLRMVSEGTFLKEENSNLMTKVLQKDQECQELQEHLQSVTKENKDLKSGVNELKMVNENLKLQALALQEENDLLHSQLSAFRRKFTGGSTSNSGLPRFALWNPSQMLHNSGEVKECQEYSETWEDLSELMLKQMHLEINQLDSVSQSTKDTRTVPLASHEDISTEDAKEAEHLCSETDPISQHCELESARSVIQLLKAQVDQLKTQLSTQGTVLRNTLGQVHKFCSADPSLRLKSRVLSQSSQGNDNLTSSSKFNRPTDELFRAYFTQQLHSSAALRTQETEAKTVLATSSDDCDVKQLNVQDKTDSHEKICPICQVVLPPGTPQEEFEGHVLDCLDHENTLEQFEVV